MHYFGQLAALNDCLYRAAMMSHLVVFTDLDELIVPRRRATWAELIDDVTKQWRQLHKSNGAAASRPFPGAYVVQNAFFRSDWDIDDVMGNDDVVRGLDLKTLLTTGREERVWPWGVRSKFIVWARLTRMVGVHRVLQFVDDAAVWSARVGPEEALLQHYRLAMWPDDPASPPVRVVDRRMHAFRDELVGRVAARHRKLKQALQQD